MKLRNVVDQIIPDLNENGLSKGSKEEIKKSFLDNLSQRLGSIPSEATPNHLYIALALTIRDRVFQKVVKARTQFVEQDKRKIAYLSAEYLPGPHLANNLLNLEISNQTREALKELDLDLDELLNQEQEPGLGNGGLGRLASCYMDALATLGINSVGYGIRYEFGIFRQGIENGWQVEFTDYWLRSGNPWEVMRPDISYEVKFGGSTQHKVDNKEKYQVDWKPASVVKGVAFDTPILGYKSNGVIMRLWKSEAIESFNFYAFNKGEYHKAVEAKVNSENITKVLYPNDESRSGKELRLKQQYFFVSCSLQDMIYKHLQQGREINNFHEKNTIQLNDTHPSIAVAELMRLLVDEHQMEWKPAWHTTQQTFAYTNHTLLPEALEKWTVDLLGSLLPRHLEIIYEINRRFILELRNEHEYTEGQIEAMSIIEDGQVPTVRMAYLATVGSYKVNGVSALHSQLLKKHVLHNFAQLWPEKFVNVTNGVTPRRFLALSNPSLTSAITEKIGEDWLKEMNRLHELEAFAEDEEFQQKWINIKLKNKEALSNLIEETTGVKLNPNMLFDVHVKRIHEYKRQHLKVLHILSLYLRLKKGKDKNVAPTAFIFAGKAAPGYFMAKRIIKLINAVAELINNDHEVQDTLKVVFLPNFSVKQAQQVYPAADLSEQISMAGKEASGTGNMKFSLNGALTVGTLDGANVEIREEVGASNFFEFGLGTEEVQETKSHGYEPHKVVAQNQELKEVLEFLVSGKLSHGDNELFRPIYDNLMWQDPYLLLADYQSYINCQENIHAVWRQPKEWARMSISNVANMGKFSSDRSIKDYAEKIWKIDVEENNF